jgi:AcrR family transcriptional regulator
MLYFNQTIDMRRRTMKESRPMQDEHGTRMRGVHRDERRRSLILAAYELIAEKGFEHLRTRDVAARAGVNIATLHYYFASKEDLIPGVMDHLLHEFRTSPATPSTVDITTPLEQVRAMFLSTYNRFQAKPGLFTVLSELVLRSLRDASLRPALQRLDEEWQMYLQHIIMDGICQGIFRTDLDPEVMATKLIILIKGFLFHRITSPGDIDFQQVLDDVEHLLLP